MGRPRGRTWSVPCSVPGWVSTYPFPSANRHVRIQTIACTAILTVRAVLQLHCRCIVARVKVVLGSNRCDALKQGGIAMFQKLEFRNRLRQSILIEVSNGIDSGYTRIRSPASRHIFDSLPCRLPRVNAPLEISRRVVDIVNHSLHDGGVPNDGQMA